MSPMALCERRLIVSYIVRDSGVGQDNWKHVCDIVALNARPEKPIHHLIECHFDRRVRQQRLA